MKKLWFLILNTLSVSYTGSQDYQNKTTQKIQIELLRVIDIHTLSNVKLQNQNNIIYCVININNKHNLCIIHGTIFYCTNHYITSISLATPNQINEEQAGVYWHSSPCHLLLERKRYVSFFFGKKYIFMGNLTLISC